MFYSYTNCPSIHHTNLYEHNHTACVHMYVYTLLYSGGFQEEKLHKSIAICENFILEMFAKIIYN